MYVVGTQKNHLNKSLLLNNQNIIYMGEILQFLKSWTLEVQFFKLEWYLQMFKWIMVFRFIIWKLIREAITISLIQQFELDFLWKVNLKILNSRFILKLSPLHIFWQMNKKMIIWTYALFLVEPAEVMVLIKACFAAVKLFSRHFICVSNLS